MCKCCIAGVISLIVLSLFSAVYYNPPIATVQPDGVTNYKYVPNTGWSYMLEGFGHGKTDSTGYNSAYYSDATEYDIVFAGSSHLEALNVPSDANFVYLLNEMLDTDDLSDNDYKCLNLGVSGHFFEVTASNYEYIADKFADAKYIVIEVFNAEYSADVLDGILENRYREPMAEKGAIYEAVKRIPFVRLMYKKIGEVMSVSNAAALEVENNASLNADEVMAVYTEKMSAVLEEIAAFSSEKGITPIILMHERFWENSDGGIVMETNEDYKAAFKLCCEDNGIKVIDVCYDMVAYYEATDILPYGFSNSVPGEGHLNVTGHRIIAECVYKFITETEAAE